MVLINTGSSEMGPVPGLVGTIDPLFVFEPLRGL